MSHYSLPTISEVLARYLANLARVLSDSCPWRELITERLYRKGERISFLAGDPARNEFLDGAIEGIGKSGELLFRLASSGCLVSLFSGEIPFPHKPT